jgi:hypothetical protein
LLLTGIIEKNTVFSTETVQDSLKTTSEKSKFEDEIIKNAKDSIKIDIVNEQIHLYGSAKIEYENIKIDAGYIIIDLVHLEYHHILYHRYQLNNF